MKSAAGSKWLRPVLIFVLTAAAAAAGLYFLLPRSAGVPPTEVPPLLTGPEAGTDAKAAPETEEIFVGSEPAQAAKEAGSAAGPGKREIIDPEIGESEKAGSAAAGGEHRNWRDLDAHDFSNEPVKGAPHPDDARNETPYVPENTAVAADPAAETAEIDRLLAEENYSAARERSLALLARLTPASQAWRETAKRLTEANRKIYFDAPPELYVVKSGDTMYKIAYRYKTTVEAVMRQNHLNTSSDLIRVGQKLKLYPGNWRIVVDKAAHLLKVYDGDDLFSVYDVGIGREAKRTPAGKFVIADKQANPAYYAPDGRVIPYGESGNVLGSRWLKLVAADRGPQAPQGYGIHGTTDESSVTRSLSNGCIRMRNAEVEELFIIVPTNTPVAIEE